MSQSAAAVAVAVAVAAVVVVLAAVGDTLTLIVFEDLILDRLKKRRR